MKEVGLTCSQSAMRAAGCVLAELLLGQPIFPGDSGVDQLVEIIKVLGTPTREQIKDMNPNYTELKFPMIKAHPWSKVFRPRTSTEAIALCSNLLEYRPAARITPLKACSNTFFDVLRQPDIRLPNKNPLPPLFNFTRHELQIEPNINELLMPVSASSSSTAAGGELPAGSSTSATSAATDPKTEPMSPGPSTSN